MQAAEYQSTQSIPFLPLSPSRSVDEDGVSGWTVCWFSFNSLLPLQTPLTTRVTESWFQTLRVQWHRERGATSSITRMAMCPAYQNIVALGRAVIPYILRQLESEGDEPDMWFWALSALTQGYDPVPESDRGDFRAMADAWLKWGHMRYAW